MGTSDSSRSVRVTIPTGRPCSDDDQRLRLAGQQLDRLAHRVDGRDAGERRLHHVGDRRGHHLRVAHRAPSAARARRREPTTVYGSSADTTGSCETRCSCSSAIASRTGWCGLDDHERRDLARPRLLAQHVADGAVAGALQEAVLGHPLVVEDLRQVAAPAVGQDHGDHRLRVADARPRPRAPRASRARTSRRPAGPRSRPAGASSGTSRGRRPSRSGRPPTGRRSPARSPRPTPSTRYGWTSSLE